MRVVGVLEHQIGLFQRSSIRFSRNSPSRPTIASIFTSEPQLFPSLDHDEQALGAGPPALSSASRHHPANPLRPSRAASAGRQGYLGRTIAVLRGGISEIFFGGGTSEQKSSRQRNGRRVVDIVSGPITLRRRGRETPVASRPDRRARRTAPVQENISMCRRGRPF